ncbi:MAG: IscS subfamily cysteine desulfurase [Omnitrophica bacterium RIFCSPLOWO2_12_FULL_50_11]|nr:MAG: IscS subfamily cysteine desulfurase [Omnitrophica bacterium RIFCSPLOWO2_12_FULL_50_11]
MKLPIYMDHQSTTPVDPAVLEAMLPYLKNEFGNAASRHHSFGWRAQEAVEDARRKIARLIGAEDPAEIIFTSGATESNNLAILGISKMYRERGSHIITTAIEHRAVLDTCKYLETQGFQVTYLPVDKNGLIRLRDLEGALTKKTILITVMYANNEIGVLQPVSEIGRIAKERGAFFHCDAVQAVGKIPVDVGMMNMHLVSISAHKMYGPKGIGALYVRSRKPRVRISPLIHGGGHEHGLRSGTLNVPAIVGFGKAAEVSAQVMEEESKRLLRLRGRLRKGISEKLDEVYVNGSLEERLPGNLNISFAFVEGESLLKGITEEIAVSSGSACTSAAAEPSYVLKALGVSEAFVHTSVRFGLGRFNTEEEVDYTIQKVVEVVKHLRAQSSLYEMHRQGSDPPLRLPSERGVA